MRTIWRPRRAGLFSLLLLSAALTAAPPPEPPLTLSIFPRRDAMLTMRLFTPLARYLEGRLGRRVELRTAADFEAFRQGLETRRPDLVHLNQYHYIQMHVSLGYQALVQNEEFGETRIRGALYVRRDSAIDQVAQLRGRRIIFGGDRSAMMSYIVPTSLLREAGLEAGAYRELFATSPPNAVIATYLGQADAGGAGEVVLQLPNVRAKLDPAGLRRLARSAPLSHLPWAVRPGLATTLKDRLRSLLLGLKDTPEGRAVLASAQLTGFNPATDSDYDPHRAILRQVWPDGPPDGE